MESLLDISIESSTLLMAFFTFALAAFSLWQTLITRRSARQQVRAYIGIQSGRIEIISNPTTALIHIELINTGQSPAYNLTTWLMAKVDTPSASPFKEELAISDRTGRSVCVPGASTHCNTQLDISPDDFQELRNGTKSIFIWGGADYKDSFNKRRYFKLRAIGAADYTNIWAIRPHKDGYDAN